MVKSQGMTSLGRPLVGRSPMPDVNRSSLIPAVKQHKIASLILFRSQPTPNHKPQSLTPFSGPQSLTPFSGPDPIFRPWSENQGRGIGGVSGAAGAQTH